MTSPLLRAANPDPTASGPTSPSRLRRFGKAVRAPLILVSLATAGLLVSGQLSKSEAQAAKAGDCTHTLDTGSKASMEIVSCTKPEAQYKVVKAIRDEGQYRPCEAEGPEVFGSYTEKRTSTVVILCLALNTERPGGPVPLPNWPQG
ncbi:hypothetical protein ACIRYZ_13725 [Kitasatospora sp. NPDC101155]|uniref:LppU/SCO3897 family protein n=1 Tax=Kitasatospora sp. NPDC101155 TaxID=3364097 RepID=UPI00380F72B2